MLVDPNEALLRPPPRDERDLVIAGSNGRMITLENLSVIPPWLSDALCRVAAGSGFATRELYSDADEAIFRRSVAGRVERDRRGRDRPATCRTGRSR